jgi:thioredoxin reductase (NADPH)
MAETVSPARRLIDTRFEQMFPKLEPAEIERLRRFGETRTYSQGDRLVTAGDVSPGMFVILTGEVALIQHSALEGDQPIVTYVPGSFMGEVAQLSGRPSLTDGRATKPVEALVIPSRRLRDVLVAEAEVGERIMRALILRRVGLIERASAVRSYSGVRTIPAFCGSPGSSAGTVTRTSGSIPRRTSPRRHWTERFGVDTSELPIVLCPNGRLLRNPTEVELAACIGLVQPIDPARLFDVAIVGAGPGGLAAAVYGASEGLSVIVIDARAFGGQAGASARIENYLGFPTGITGMALMARAFTQAQKFGAEVAIPDEVVHLERIAGGAGARFASRTTNGCGRARW